MIVTLLIAAAFASYGIYYHTLRRKDHIPRKKVFNPRRNLRSATLNVRSTSLNGGSTSLNVGSTSVNENFYYAKIQLYPILNKTFTEYLHFFIHNSLFFAPISLRIPNNSVNFVVRLQDKGQRIARQRAKDCKTKAKGLQAKDKAKD